MSVPDNQVFLDILDLLYKRISDDPEGPGVDRAIIQATLQISLKQMDDSTALLAGRNLVILVGNAGGKWAFAKITTDGIDAIENKERYAEKLSFAQTPTNQNPTEGSDKAFKMVEPHGFNERVVVAFKQASDQVLGATISAGEKGKLAKHLMSLEKELLKARKADLNSIRKDWEELKKSAGWLTPPLAPVMLEGMRVALDLPASTQCPE